MAVAGKERQQHDQMRERAQADRERAEMARLNRADRTRHDAIGVAQHILDPRVVHSEVIQPELIGFMSVAAENLESLSPYESGPIRDALLIKAMAGNVEKVQVKIVEARNATMEGMLANPVLVSALDKYNKGYDPDIGDRPVEMTAEEWEAFGKYEEVRGERQALVDAMTNGVASLYDDRDDLDRRTIRLSARLDNLLPRRGTLTGDDKKQYTGLLAIMFGALKGPEAANYSRWAGMDRADLTIEEQVMLDDIWEKMMDALDGGEEGELTELEKRKVRELNVDEQKLYERRRQQLLDAVADVDEKEQLRLLLDGSGYGRSEEEREAVEARLELVAEDAGTSLAELRTFEKLKDKKDAAARLAELKAVGRSLSRGERGTFEELRSKAGSLTEAEEESIAVIEKLIPELGKRKKDVEKQIKEKTAKLGVLKEWMDLAKAFSGIVSNINVTDQWRRAWHDYGAGAQDSFTQTRWAEYQRVSELVALMEMPGVGRAMQEAFRAMCLIGLNRIGEVPGSENILQMEKLTEAQVREKFVEPCRNYVKARIGDGAEDLYVNFGVEMARMLFENGGCAGWFCAKRDNDGNILYKEEVVDRTGKTIVVESSDPTSDAYRYAVPVAWGDGSVYSDRQNDYVKPWSTRAKQMKEYGAGYETGLPALVPVLPDNISKSWISHEEMVAIANGVINPIDVFNGRKAGPGQENEDGWLKVGGVGLRPRPENSRWGWAYGIFRGGQVYDLISKFIIGLKGYRGTGEEVEFFFTSAANMGATAKKIDVALRYSVEAVRLRINLFMSAVYAIDDDAANPERPDELKTVLPDMTKAPEKRWLNFDKDDYRRAFVRNGFLSAEQFEFAWKRLVNILPGEGGKVGVGLVKKSEERLLEGLGKKVKRARLLADSV